MSTQTKRRSAIVYIDGYNWYHAIFKHRPEWKWLNVLTFFRELRPDNEIVAIKFFTALVDGHLSYSEAKERHRKFITALRTLERVEVILGKFQNREVTCRATCQEKYIVPEEKKTDVNIAVHIMADAFDNRSEAIVIVSGDSDVQPPVEWVRNRYPNKKITVYIPAMPNEQDMRRLDYYKRIDAECKFLPLEGLARHQMPDSVNHKSGTPILRPSSWSSPST